MAAYAADRVSISSTGQEKNEDRVYTLSERRRAALAEVDNAKFSWFHLKVCLVAGVGFFTDAYDIFAINIASTMLGYVYGHGQKLSPNEELGVKVATPIGTLIGQLLFGWLADLLGRKRMYGVELMVIIIATLGQAIAGHAHSINILGVIIFWRFLMGVGIGGDYPLSAVMTSEFSSIHIRGRMMTAVFANQGWGQLAAAIVAIVVVAGYKDSLLHDDPAVLGSVDPMWRILIGLGCVPGAIALYFRLTVPETPRFTVDIERDVERATQDVQKALKREEDIEEEPIVQVERVEAPKASWADFCRYYSKWDNFKVLLGTSYSWFALDIAFYGLGLNTSILLTAIGFGAPDKSLTGVAAVYQNLKNVAVGNLILIVAGLVPGYWVCFLFIDSWGRKPIQFMGFAMLTALFVIMGFGYDKLTATGPVTKAFVFLACLTYFFKNFGPNVTTFVVPGEVFPTRYRSTSHGIAAASGKLGAVVAQVGFARLKDIGGPNAFVKHILQLFAFFCLTGILSTFLIPETKGKSLEDLSSEDRNVCDANPESSPRT